MACACKRSPTGRCIGWHNLSEEDYQIKLAEWHKKNKTKEEKEKSQLKEVLDYAMNDDIDILSKLKIVMTGHTKGLGQFLYNEWQKIYDVSGFSRSTGYDIRSPASRKEIVGECADADVFVNLVHNYYHQSDLLLEVHKLWQGQSKLIINVGSKAANDPEFGKENYQLLEYKTQKKNLLVLQDNLTKSFELPQVRLHEIEEINFQADLHTLNTIIKTYERQIFKK